MTIDISSITYGKTGLVPKGRFLNYCKKKYEKTTDNLIDAVIAGLGLGVKAIVGGGDERIHISYTVEDSTKIILGVYKHHENAAAAKKAKDDAAAIVANAAQAVTAAQLELIPPTPDHSARLERIEAMLGTVINEVRDLKAIWTA